MDLQQSALTYEAKKAQEWNASQADKIHWEKGKAFRNQNYRSLFHQNGRIGTFSVRLLEAADLKRSYWSALALGPMKHLGLSKAHGGVSSFVSFCLDTSSATTSSGSFLDDESSPPGGGSSSYDMDRKMPAKSSSKKKQLHRQQQNPLHQMPIFVSPVKQQDSNPVWTNFQFEMPLKKGVLEDGQPVRIFLRVDEDATAIEKIPGIPTGGDRLLGVGSLDVTSLCLGQVPVTGRASAGVIDEWVPIRLPSDIEEEEASMMSCAAEQELLWQHAKNGGGELKKPPPKVRSEEERNKIRGRVRILVTYHPHGMNPQQHDIVALEAFARQNLRSATCTSILPPLLPMNVLEVSEPWLLVEYSLPFALHSGDSQNNNANNNKACLKVHRNAVFVIERKNLLDATLDVALKPADFLLSTPIGHGAREIFGPLFVAGKQLMMPALLSSKLVWMAVRATTLASITGVAAAGSAFVSEGTNSLTNDGRERQRKSYDENGRVKYVSL
ncbi:hypothetical protein IV203_025863 [Nitzschia inconspicua]|uniref:Uncharacterized protein n=1 Tax=Nitzschia inconspicua TaxID=303405 RepID=A0A9K3LHL2_9STRA|nr:hypothetical protein IV203_025863 [Nitzschia inconspicua]